MYVLSIIALTMGYLRTASSAKLRIFLFTPNLSSTALACSFTLWVNKMATEACQKSKIQGGTNRPVQIMRQKSIAA